MTAKSENAVGRILVVDDEIELKNALVDALSAQSFEVRGFTSGQEALAALRSADFDLLISDLMMPEMDGIELITAALEIDPNLVAIIMTGQGTIQTAVESMQAGTVDYVLKPFRLQTLMPILTRAINTRRLRKENLQLRETLAIYELAQTIAFTLDPQTLISKLADAALQQTDADEVSVLLPTDDGSELYVAAVRGENRQRLLGERIPLKEGIASWVARERMPLILNGEVSDERFVAQWPRPEIRSAVSVPMQVANKLIGIINLNVTNGPRPFTLGQMKALTILSSTGAAALESASLYTKVRRAEENYRSIFENAVEGIFQATLEGRFIKMNPAMARILGYGSPQEAIEEVTDIARQIYVDPEIRSELDRIEKQQKILQGFEFEAYRKDGERIWLSLNRRSILDEGGTEIYREGSVEDITERKQAEERVRQSERLMAEAQQLAHVGSWNWDLPTNILSWSDEHYHILGLDPKEFDPTFDAVRAKYVIPEDHDSVRSVVSRILENHEPFDFHYRVQRPDGQVRIVHSQGSLLCDEQGTPMRMFGTVQDVTERKRAEEEREQLAAEIENQGQRLDNIIGTVPGVVWEAWGQPDAANQRIDFISDYVETMLGYSVDEWLETPNFWLTIIHPDDREQAAGISAAAFAAGRSTTMEFRWIRKDGRTIWVESNFVVIKDNEDQPVGLRGVTTDISERKRVEAQRELLSSLVQASPDFIGYADAKTAQILYINKHGRKMCGIGEDEDLAPLKISDVHPGWMNQRMEEVVLPAAVREGVWEGDAAFLNRDGSEIPVSMVLMAHKAANGEVDIFYTVSRDITERKKAEAELHFQKSLLEAQSEASIDGILVVSQTGQILSYNKPFVDLWGISEELLSGSDEQALSSVVPLLAKPEEMLARVDYLYKHPEEEWRDEIELTDGRTFDRYSAPIKNTQDEYYGRVWFFRDITERKQAEGALRVSEERYRDLVENAHDIIYSHDLQGNYTSMNKAAELITGYTPEEALSMNLSQMMPAEHLPTAQEMVGRKLAGERVTAYETELIAKDGHRVAVEANTKLVFQDGVPVGVQGIARDVTERKHLEDQLRQSQKLEGIGQLAGGVAHDFNNLLTAINGYTSLALQRLDEHNSVRPYLEEVKKAGDRAANLTRQLLAFGRKQILQPIPLDLNGIVSDMNKMLRRLIGEDINLSAKLAIDLKRIKADPGQIEQVLMNLVVNARDAMPTGGKLTIETTNAELDREYASTHVGVNPGAYVVLAVSDTGTGMSEQVRKQIFEPFFTTKEKGKGTGLGLSTVYGVVKQSGGNIWVYSEPNHGTTFKVYLPALASTSTSSEAKAAESPIPRGSETVLLVEDEEVVRGLARKILEDAGYSVLVAPQGEEAVRLCNEHTNEIHLLLTDVVMPGAGGKVIADRLSALRPGIKVLFMSGYTDEAIVHHGVLDSNVEFIQKPFTPMGLSKKVREVLDSNGHPHRN